MIATTIKVHIEDDGTVRISPRTWATLGVEPPSQVELYLEIAEPKPAYAPVRLTPAQRENLKRIGELIEETFAGMDLEYVREGRRDRWF